jgi:DNA-directed RNA polymerase subunit RPC12/RpoP
MSKIKMRCSQCGKSFKSANARQLICPECEEKARKERAARAKGAQLPASAPAPAPRQILPAKPARPAAPASAPKQHWLDKQTDVKIAPPEPPASSRPPRLDMPERRPSAQPSAPGASASGNPARAHTPPSSQARRPAPAQQPGAAAGASAYDQKAKKADQQKRADGARPKGGKAAAAPKPKREPRQPTPPFTPTPEQVAAIEQRYLELAQPGEFDGIRTQISKELGIPKSAVKKVVRALRERQDIPSWWDLQAYHGSPEDLERIRAAYTPLLPRPAVGVHKQIAALLNLPAGTVYQAIKVIRAEMNLPQYNPPQATDAPLGAR